MSVVIPVYNAEQYLADTLRSVFAQTFQDYEVICVNDGSNDDSGAVLDQFSDRVRVIHQRNSGQAVALNRGVQQASGRFLAFLDADDLWYQHKLAEQVEVMAVNQHLVMVNCNYDVIDTDGKLLRAGVALAAHQSVDMTSPLMRLLGLPVEIPSFMLIRREAFERIGGFDPELSVWDIDYDLCVRLRDVGRFRFIEASGGAKRVHPASNTYFSEYQKKRLQCAVHFGEQLQLRYAGDPEKHKLSCMILADRYSDLGW